jgi:uncharacterized membrane protein YjfL (UPF0719 family)
MQDYIEDLASVFAYGALGIALLVVGFYVIDALTPGKLGQELVERRSANAAIVVGAGLLAIGAVVTSSIAASLEDDLLKGLGSALGYGVAGIVLQGVAFRVRDTITPGRLGDVIYDRQVAPIAVVHAAFSIAVGAMLAASIA